MRGHEQLTCQSFNARSLEQPGGGIASVVVVFVFLRVLGRVQRVPTNPDADIGCHLDGLYAMCYLGSPANVREIMSCVSDGR